MKINDNVSVIDEDLQGIVTSVREDTITIKDKFGFTHQYHKDKLVIRDHSFYDKIKIKDNTNTSNQSLKNMLTIVLSWICILINWSINLKNTIVLRGFLFKKTNFWKL